jgi:hypothetical protein
MAFRAELVSLDQALITSRSDGSPTDLEQTAPDFAPPLAESSVLSDDF